MRDANDSGEPLTLTRNTPNAEKELFSYQTLACAVSKELLRIQYGHTYEDETIFVSFDGENNERFDVSSVALSLKSDQFEDKILVIRLFSNTGAVQREVQPAELRGRDPRTGNTIPDSPFSRDNSHNGLYHTNESNRDTMITNASSKRRKSPSIIPSSVAKRGRYGFAVVWQDGATIIYSNRCIALCAGGKVSNFS
jgi:hypothetical protein